MFGALRVNKENDLSMMLYIKLNTGKVAAAPHNGQRWQLLQVPYYIQARWG